VNHNASICASAAASLSARAHSSSFLAIHSNLARALALDWSTACRTAPPAIACDALSHCEFISVPLTNPRPQHEPATYAATYRVPSSLIVAHAPRSLSQTQTQRTDLTQLQRPTL
jgi:hypothetical protein